MTDTPKPPTGTATPPVTPTQANIILSQIPPYLEELIETLLNLVDGAAPVQAQDATAIPIEEMDCEQLAEAYSNSSVYYSVIAYERPDCFKPAYTTAICETYQSNIANDMSEVEALVQAIQAVAADPDIPFTIVFLGGSYDDGSGDPGVEMLGPDPIEDVPIWANLASTEELQVRYPGVYGSSVYAKYNHPDEVASIEGVKPITDYRGKWGQAQRAIDILRQQELLDTEILVIGYSAGADAAPMFAYQHMELQEQGDVTGNISGVIMLGPNISGSMETPEGSLTLSWEEVFNDILSSGADIYIFDDSVIPEVTLSDYNKPPEAEGDFVHAEQNNVDHNLPQNLDPQGTATNNNQELQRQILSWWFSNHGDCE